MDKNTKKQFKGLGRILDKINLKLRPKLILIFLIVKVIPIMLLTAIAWSQIATLGNLLREIAVEDSSKALNDGAIENIERMTTSVAQGVAKFLYARDDDILALSHVAPSDEAYRAFSQAKSSQLVRMGEWVLSRDGMSWENTDSAAAGAPARQSSNPENNDIVQGSSFNYRAPDSYTYDDVPLYDEIAFIDLSGNQVYKYTSPDSPKKHYPVNPEKVNISDKNNTYIGAESYFEELKKLAPGDIYVSDVIGVYTQSSFIGMYTIDAMGVKKVTDTVNALKEDGGDEDIIAILSAQEILLRGEADLTEIIENLKREAPSETLSALVSDLDAIIQNYAPEKQA